MIERTAGAWIVEMAELTGMRRSEIEAVKASLSRRTDKARLAYGRLPTEVPRQFVMAASTNDDAYLRDMTGNRRFWPVAIHAFDVEALLRDRDQLWAEAAEREASGASIRLDPSMYPTAAVEQEARQVEDPFLERLEEALGHFDHAKIRAEDVWLILGMDDVAARTHGDTGRRMGRAMRKLGWERRQLRINNQRVWFYLKGRRNPSTGKVELTGLCLLQWNRGNRRASWVKDDEPSPA